MNLRSIAKAVLDELGFNDVPAMDGPDVSQGGWLTEHDRRYHGGHYQEGQRCKLRERLGINDNADRIDGQQQQRPAIFTELNGLPTRSEYEDVLVSAMNNGLVDDETRDMLAQMGDRVWEVLEGDDESDDPIPQDAVENIRDLRDIVAALRDAMSANGQNVGNGEQTPAPNAEGQQNAATEGGNEAQAEDPHSLSAIHGHLGEDSVVLNGQFANATISSTARNMKKRPENLRASDITGEYLANICDRLPNVFSSAFAGPGNCLRHNGDVTISGFGTMPKMEAFRRALSQPDSPLGRELFRRLDKFAHDNPDHPKTGYVPKLKRALELLPYSRETPAQSASWDATLGGTVTREMVLAERQRLASMPVMTNRDINEALFRLRSSMDQSVLEADKANAPEDIRATWRADNHQFYDNRSSIMNGCNCWKTVCTLFAQLRGFKVTPKAQEEGGTQKATFIKSQLAMGRAYERYNGTSYEQTEQNLNHIARGNPDGHPPTMPYPNGTMMLSWSGSHAMARIVMNGRLYIRDPFRASTWSEYDGPRENEATSPDDIRRAMQDIIPNYESQWAARVAAVREALDRGRAVDHDVIKAKLMMMQFTMMKRRMRTFVPDATQPSGQRAVYPPDNEIIEACARDSEVNFIEGSYVIRPDQPLIPELFTLMKPAAY